MTESVLLLGGGSREHALVWKLLQSPKLRKIYVSPGNAGIALQSNSVEVLDLDIKNNDQIVKWCEKNKPELVICGPEDPLDNGISDALDSIGIKCFGPKKNAAQIECDKAYAKHLMTKYDIPTADYKVFTNANEAKEFVTNSPNYLVIKASGLAAGKGVVVAANVNEACNAIDSILTENLFGTAGNTIVVEELLEGSEVSVLAFTDGTQFITMLPSQDHKRAYDNDTGPNTGGMGAYCPYPFIDSNTSTLIEREILKKTIDALREEGRTFVGVLYAGLMITKTGPKVIEFNCRFGDPETQSILPLLDSDLYDICLACTQGNLNLINIKWKNKFSCGVVVANEGYPQKPIHNNQLIEGIDNALNSGFLVFHGATSLMQNNFHTSGGRILTVVAVENILSEAADKARYGASLINIKNSFYRKDIANKAIKRLTSRLDYKSSGVDIEVGDKLVSHIKKFAQSTERSGVIDQIGGFGALFDLKDSGYTDPILVSGTDGVGTKLKIAIECEIYDTVGIDLVAMCVNDILVQGAEPLFFLDYFACNQLKLNVAAQVIQGIAKGCQMANSALIGGETAEMPGMYSDGDFDLAGFAVGAVNRDSILPRISEIKENDVIIGLLSSGVHSNGFSLVRKLLETKAKNYTDKTPFDKNSSFADILLTPTKIYVKSLLNVIKKGYIKALAHITGGGLMENIPRILPKHLSALIDANKWPIQPIFKWIKQEGNIDEIEMLRTFNCGIGMICIIDPNNTDIIMREIESSGDQVFSIGKIVKRENDAVLVNNFMTPTIKINKKRVAILISGIGSNLQAIIDYVNKNTNNTAIDIVLVISNKRDVEGVERAKKAGIPTKVIVAKKDESRLEYDMRVHKILEQFSVDIVCLAGYMRILSNEFVNLWNAKLINIHPSLLPSFKGMHAYKQALEAGVQITGCTVHFVSTEMDCGAIISQEFVRIDVNDTVQSLETKGKRVEHNTYPRALELVAQQKVCLSRDGNSVVWNI